MTKRGKKLETRVNKCNLGYRQKRLAVIQQINTPVLLTQKGVVSKTSTVDYIGVIGSEGKAISFDAKETNSKTSFPLSNIKDHQLLFLDYWESCGGDAFFLVHFKTLYMDRAFRTPLSAVHKYTDNKEGRRSIPINDFKESWLVPIDNYLNLINDHE